MRSIQNYASRGGLILPHLLDFPPSDEVNKRHPFREAKLPSMHRDTPLTVKTSGFNLRNFALGQSERSNGRTVANFSIAIVSLSP